MSDERERVEESVERCLRDVLKLDESVWVDRIAITGSTAEDMFVESVKAELPVRVIVWKQWVIRSKKFKTNNVKDLASLRRVVIRDIHDRLLAQCRESMNQARGRKAPLEWKLVRSKSDKDDSILIKSRTTGVMILIQVAGIITDIECVKERSFLVELPSERDAILNEFKVQRQMLVRFLKGDHSVEEDHQRFREVLEQNIDAILAPVQWYEIATLWFQNRDPRAVACREAVWDRIMAGKKRDACDLESVPADEFVCAIIERQLRLNPKIDQSDLIDAVFARLIEIASKLDPSSSSIPPAEPMVIQALVDEKKNPPGHLLDCLGYIGRIETPRFVNTWKQHQLNLRQGGQRKKKKDLIPRKAKVSDPVIVLASNGRKASLMNDFCDWFGLVQALKHDFRVSSSSAKESMTRPGTAVGPSQLFRDNRVLRPSPHLSIPPVPPLSGNFLFAPQAMSIAPPPPPPPMGWMPPSSAIADSPVYYQGVGAAPAWSSQATSSFSSSSSTIPFPHYPPHYPFIPR